MATFYPDGKGPSGWWAPMYGLRLRFAVEDPDSWEMVFEAGKMMREGPMTKRWSVDAESALWDNGHVERYRDWLGEHVVGAGITCESAVALDLFKLELSCEECGKPFIREVVDESESAARDGVLCECDSCLDLEDY